MRTLLILIAALVSIPAHAAEPTPLKLYVFAHADPSGLVDVETQARHKLAVDIAKKLRDKKPFALVDSPAVADATLEVTDEISSEPHNNAFWIGLAGIGNVSHARHAVLTMGDYSTGFAARVSVATAEGIAQLVVDWEKTNRATLEKLRRP